MRGGASGTIWCEAVPRNSEAARRAEAQSCWPTPKSTSTSISPRAKPRPISKHILAAAQTPLELAISKLGTDTPDQNLSRALEPILPEVGRLGPIEQDRHLRLIQAQCGKGRLPVTTLRKQLKVVEIARPKRTTRTGAFVTEGQRHWRARQSLSAARHSGQQSTTA